MEENNDDNHVTTAGMCRKEKRKLLKKLKRKQLRREIAIKDKEIADDPEETARLLLLEKEEAERMERDRIAFEERERLFLLELDRKNNLLQQQLESEEVTNGDEDESNEGEGVDWEYVEEGPAEIIWKGNEIIVKKKKVKVPKKVIDNLIEKKESERPISNPLAPQSEAYNDYRSAQEVLESVAQQVPNFGTEQDKAHCPFHLKTGVCRFGASCSRAHFYPDKSCTLLFKNMYNGPGLGCNQDEGLEYTDEEVERSFEEFYEDVHTEFLKYGEIMNFKVCKNASSHLRGNVYVHYKSLESAVLAYQSINGRYFAGKQLSCKFVNLTKWKVAICGEYMRSRLKTCSRGSACNFIHCFRNPGGDYEWADWDKPAPRYWVKEMGALFGYTDDKFTDETLSYYSNRSRSRDPDSSHRKNHSDDNDNDDGHRRRSLQLHRSDFKEKIRSPENNRTKRRKPDSIDKSDFSSDEQKRGHRSSNNSRRERDRESTRRVRTRREHHSNADDSESRKRKGGDRSSERHRSYKKLNDSKKSPQKDWEVSKYSLQKKEAFSSDTDSLGRHKSLRMKDEAYLSDGDSSGSRFGSDVKSEKKRINISMSNSKSEYREFKRKSDSLERDEDKSYNHTGKSSRACDGGRIETDEKRPHKSRGKSKRSDNQAGSIDSESEKVQDRAEGRLRRSTKSHKRLKHEAESSENASNERISRKYEKEPKKDRRRRSMSKNDSDFLDIRSNTKILNKEDRCVTEDACFRSLDGKAEDDLEQTFRMAALKKLEEMRKCKVGEDAEGSKELEEISPPRKARTSAASVSRKRI